MMATIHKIGPLILLGIALGLAICSLFMKKQSGINREYVDSVMLSNKQVFKYDSIKSVIEDNLYDSMNLSIELMDTEIKKVKRQNYLLRKSNEELERKYRSIIVDLPEL